mgnify:CR=1 FL=1
MDVGVAGRNIQLQTGTKLNTLTLISDRTHLWTGQSASARQTDAVRVYGFAGLALRLLPGKLILLLFLDLLV